MPRSSTARRSRITCRACSSERRTCTCTTRGPAALQRGPTGRSMPGMATPMLTYEHGADAMDWLARAFGFVEKTRMLGKNGRLAHGELDTGDGLVMLASPTPDYESPRRHREHCDAARRWSAVPWVIDGVHVYVADVAA